MLVLQCKKGCEKDMLLFEFDVSRPVEYALTGKFEAPTPSWQHQLAPLIEYELFVVTKDTLYISYAGEQFEVSEGEFLILPPTPPPHEFSQGISGIGLQLLLAPLFCSGQSKLCGST